MSAALESNGPTTCGSFLEYMQYSGVSIVTVCKLWHLQPSLDAMLLTALIKPTEYSAVVLLLVFLGVVIAIARVALTVMILASLKDLILRYSLAL